MSLVTTKTSYPCSELDAKYAQSTPQTVSALQAPPVATISECTRYYTCNRQYLAKSHQRCAGQGNGTHLRGSICRGVDGQHDADKGPLRRQRCPSARRSGSSNSRCLMFAVQRATAAWQTAPPAPSDGREQATVGGHNDAPKEKSALCAAQDPPPRANTTSVRACQCPPTQSTGGKHTVHPNVADTKRPRPAFRHIFQVCGYQAAKRDS